MAKVVLIAHNIRSAHNIGSLMRTAEGLGIHELVISGYSPYPQLKADERPPHIRRLVSSKINKTALGAQNTLKWRYGEKIKPIIEIFKSQNYVIAALEQTVDAIDLSKYENNSDIVLIVGNEVTGIEPGILKSADVILHIPMMGNKESFNVTQAAAMALYRLKHP